MFFRFHLPFSLLSQCCAYVLVRVRHKNQLVGKTSCFGLKYLVATNMAGDVMRSCSDFLVMTSVFFIVEHG